MFMFISLLTVLGVCSCNDNEVIEPVVSDSVSDMEVLSRFVDVNEITNEYYINENKKTWFPTEKRVEMIEKLFADDPRVKVDAYDCLTIDFARAKEAQFIVRGIRTVHDFEYEETIADINRKLAGIETILLFTEPELTSISSTIVRELLQFGKDVTPFLPEGMKID